MQYAIVDEHFYHLPSSPYKYLTIYFTKDYDDNDLLKFRVNLTNFTETQNLLIRF